MSIVRFAARRLGGSLLPRRQAVVERLGRRLDTQRRLLSNEPEEAEHMRKALMEDRFRMDIERKVVRDSWERLVFVRGKLPLPKKKEWVGALVLWLAPKTPQDLISTLLYGTLFLALLAEMSKSELEKGTKSSWELKKDELREKLFQSKKD